MSQVGGGMKNLDFGEKMKFATKASSTMGVIAHKLGIKAGRDSDNFIGLSV
jgi:hypothetical protein